MRHFVVADVHGAGLELKQLVAKMNLQQDDKLIFVGDLFDRGEHADIVWQIVHQYNADVLLGNHERKYLQFIQGERKWLPKHYDYAWNILSNSGVSLKEFKAFLKSLPLVKQYQRGDGKGTFVVAHGGVNITDPAKEDLSANVYAKLPQDESMPIPQPHETHYWWDMYEGDELVLYGHLASHDGLPRVRFSPRSKINSIGLDTGAVHGGALTGYCVEEDRFYTYQSGIDYWRAVKQNINLKEPQKLVRLDVMH